MEVVIIEITLKCMFSTDSVLLLLCAFKYFHSSWIFISPLSFVSFVQIHREALFPCAVLATSHCLTHDNATSDSFFIFFLSLMTHLSYIYIQGETPPRTTRAVEVFCSNPAQGNHDAQTYYDTDTLKKPHRKSIKQTNKQNFKRTSTNKQNPNPQNKISKLKELHE